MGHWNISKKACWLVWLCIRNWTSRSHQSRENPADPKICLPWTLCYVGSKMHDPRNGGWRNPKGLCDVFELFNKTIRNLLDIVTLHVLNYSPFHTEYIAMGSLRVRCRKGRDEGSSSTSRKRSERARSVIGPSSPIVPIALALELSSSLTFLRLTRRLSW